MLSFLLTGALIATAPQQTGTQSQWDDREEQQCFDTAITQPAMTGCADAAFKRTEAGLNAQWAKTAAAFKRVDEFNKKSGEETGAFDSLLKGQRAWLIYRQATCHAQGLVNAGGTIRNMNELLCLDSITTARVKELFDLSRNPNNPDDAL